MPMQYNKNPISLREGRVYIDGVECLDSVQCEIHFTPDVWSGRQLGEVTPSSRWLGATITGTITRRRSTPFLKQIIQNFMNNGHVTPEFTIQGIMDDAQSDYYANYGRDVVTVVGCVLTGDLSLVHLESDGQVLDDNISFSAKDLV